MRLRRRRSMGGRSARERASTTAIASGWRMAVVLGRRPPDRKRVRRQDVRGSRGAAGHGDPAQVVVYTPAERDEPQARATLQAFTPRCGADRRRAAAGRAGAMMDARSAMSARPASADRARGVPLRRRRPRERRRQPHQPHAARRVPARDRRADRGRPTSAQRILRDDVEFIALHKAPGHAVWLYPRLFRAVPRAAAGDRAHPQPGGARGDACRHGWPACRCACTASTAATSAISTARTASTSGAPALPPVRHPLRRAVARLADYLRGTRRRAVEPDHADLQRRRHARFAPAAGGALPSPAARSTATDLWLVGTVGRMQAVKDQVQAGARVRPAVRRQPARARGCAW